MKNERKITKNISRKLPTKRGSIKNQDKNNKNIPEEIVKSQLKPPEFPESIVKIILDKIISYVVRQKAVKETYSNINKRCFTYLKELINPLLSAEYLNYENGLDDPEFNKNKINYKTIVTEKVNTWAFFPEPNTPGMDRYSSSSAKLISLKKDNDDFKEGHKIKELKELLSMQRKSSLIKEDAEFNKPEKKEENKKIINIKDKKRKKIKKKKIDKEKEKEKEKEIIKEKEITKEEEEKIMEEVFLALPCQDLPKEKYENKYVLINDNEENSKLRKEREYLIQKKIELKEIQDLQDKRDKLKKFQNRVQKNIDGTVQTFDSDGKIMIIHSPRVDRFINEFNFVNILNKEKEEKTEKSEKTEKTEKTEKRASTITSQSKKRISQLSKIKKKENKKENKNWDNLPENIKQIFIYIKNILLPKWMRNSYINISPEKIISNEEEKENLINKKKGGNKSFKVFFGPFLKKYVFKKNIARNPTDVAKNNIIYFKNADPKRKLLFPSGSNFELMKPETGVVIEDKSNKKTEIKDGGFEYIKKYNKPSMYEFSKLVMESSNLNSLNSRALSSRLIESKINEINEIKNRNKFKELNKDDYNGYIFEFSDNLNPLFQNAVRLNDKQKSTEDNNENKDSNEIKEEKEEKEIKEGDNYKNKNIFRAMEEGYLKSRYNSMNSLNLQRSIQLKRDIHNLYHYFKDDEPNNKIIIEKNLSKNFSALRDRRKTNNNIINEAPLPKIKVHRVVVNKKEIKEFKNRVRGRKIMNKFNYRILQDKKWGDKDENKRREMLEFENDLLRRVGSNIMAHDDNGMKRHLFKSASAGNIF